ncbi:MAG TPA: FAD-linked oxidase C-terminal domain-containing protein [Ornithinimicrobium sp.]|uniref:FAD-linked oxidase C-terminal domain-containing protein n=1 Tax=Ornithinimicrobium sp. TaxID=1977084 RepID=UPI002B4A1A86|nr:FAD-linked oxidase C-terminal domain-containing protein [Ornithinimicrobium sp.]HKJ11415.1 FAD-linked oxidase C-terminal domain-containing protein [Ornithinimicrobium sp.]
MDRLRPDQVIDDKTSLRTYECDGLTGYRVVPALVVLPESTEEVALAVRLCAGQGVPYVARGAGTGLSGGALPVADGIVICLARMRAVLEVDVANQRMTVQPGVTNAEISKVVAQHRLYFAPDPSSQSVCTIGGNIAENSGGAHCLKYGFTTQHVYAMTVVLPDGSVVEVGGGFAEGVGPDLRGVIIGSEGTLAIATAVTVRLLRTPEAVRTLVADFDSADKAGEAVSAIIAAGIVPAAAEMLDALSIQACEAAVGAGFSTDAAAALLVELDGPEADCEDGYTQVQRRCREAGATHVRLADTPHERARVWAGRKAAFAAMGRISPDYFVQDGVVPRTRLGEMLRRMQQMADDAGLRVANVFHAGDGNLHPLVLYSAAAPGEAERGEQLSTAIAELCVEMGGSITGEHGVGTDKACSMPSMFSEEDLRVMLRVRTALDPDGISNPGKIFPTPRLCGEKPGPYRPHALETAGVIERV